jgi:molybdopterin/thiamine biosynthesis adenylyltransferase
MRPWQLRAETARRRMRNATILVVNLRGLATETIKNIVLAGVGKLVILDTEDVHAEDLGSGFFFREEDIGSKVFCPLSLPPNSTPNDYFAAACRRSQSQNPKP